MGNILRRGAKSTVICCICCWVALSWIPAEASSLGVALRKGQEMLDRGEAANALEWFKELQVDYPASGELRFAMGCALYTQGDQQMELGAPEASAAAFAEARTLFDELVTDNNPVIAREATFNRANTLAREALMMAGADDYAAAVASARRAVEAYELALERYPDHDGMAQNLEHMRFHLKQLLQEPPEQQEDPEQQPSDQPPPTLVSRFGTVATQLPGAQTRHEDNTAILVLPDPGETQP